MINIYHYIYIYITSIVLLKILSKYRNSISIYNSINICHDICVRLY